MKDLIERQATIDALQEEIVKWTLPDDTAKAVRCGVRSAKNIVEDLPSAEPEIKPIGYNDCSNAMMKMWMDNVVTDGEYNRIMDKLNAYWRSKDE